MLISTNSTTNTATNRSTKCRECHELTVNINRQNLLVTDLFVTGWKVRKPLPTFFDGGVFTVKILSKKCLKNV